MAWISVHEQVLGGKLRKLAKEINCSQNEALGLLVRMWLWAINNADKYGRIVGAEKDDVSEVLILGLDKRYNPDAVVDAIINTGWIDEDEEGLLIHDWEEWQEYWYRALESRAKATERKRRERARKKEQLNALKTGMEEALPVSKFKTPPVKKETNSGYTNCFEELWKVYPRKLGKGEAYKKYKARLNDGWSEEELFDAVVHYAEKVTRERTDEKYIKHAKTFFSENTPFADYISKSDSKQTESKSDDYNPYADWRND